MVGLVYVKTAQALNWIFFLILVSTSNEMRETTMLDVFFDFLYLYFDNNSWDNTAMQT